MKRCSLTVAATIGLLFVFGSLAAAQAPETAPSQAAKAPAKKAPKKRALELEPIENDPALPRVLLIGDSISMGYTLDVRKLLAGEANVHRIPTNAGATTHGLKYIDTWLGDHKWDVIHFNWGLHDLKFVNDKEELVELGAGHQLVPVDEYEQNLRQLVTRMKKTGARLIWCTTTPVPEGSKGRVLGDERKYNEAAARVMAAEQVAIDDLGEFARPQLDKIQLPANVHFSPAGSAVLAEQVAKSIRAALPKKSAAK